MTAQQEELDQHGPGFVGVIAQENARFSLFSAALSGLRLPAGTEVGWELGNDIAGQCNLLVERALDRGAEWFWLLGDDHSFAPGLLEQLLGVRGFDLVFPLCLERKPPYRPVIFDRWVDGDGPGRHKVDLADHPNGGVIPIHSGGSAGMLVYRRVLAELEPPWFRTYAVSSGGVGEDVYFCDRARDAGFKLGADLDAPLAHLTTAAIWPLRGDYGWTYAFTMSGGHHVIDPKGWNQ